MSLLTTENLTLNSTISVTELVCVPQSKSLTWLLVIRAPDSNTHPDLKAVMMQSAQKRCRHSLVVIVFFSMSRQMGHMSSLCKDLGDTAISSPSVIASCGSREEKRVEPDKKPTVEVHTGAITVSATGRGRVPEKEGAKHEGVPVAFSVARTGSAPRSYLGVGPHWSAPSGSSLQRWNAKRKDVQPERDI